MKRSIFLILSIVLFFSGIVKGQWATLNGPPAGSIASITRISPYVFCIGFNGGLFRSDDDGISWRLIRTPGLPSSSYNSILADGNNIFLCCNNGLYKTTDFGLNWTESDLEVSPSDKTTLSVMRAGSYLFLLTQSKDNPIYGSPDSGKTWKTVSDYLPPNFKVSVICTQDSVVFAGSGGNGVFLSTDFGKSWKDGNGNRQIGWFTEAMFNDGKRVFASFAQYATWYTTDKGATWTVMPKIGEVSGFGQSETTLFSNTRLGGYQDPDIWRSTDGGDNWTIIQNTLPAQMELSPIAAWNTTVLTGLSFAGASIQSKAIYRSTDNGNNWVISNQGLSNSFITALFKKGNRLFAGTISGDVFFSDDHGKHWLHPDSGTQIVPFAGVKALYSSSSVLLAGLGEFFYPHDQTGAIYRSTDEGKTWKIVLDYRSTYAFTSLGNTLFAATSDGIFKTVDDGATWERAALKGTSFNSICAISNKIIASDGHYLYESIDVGNSWVQANSQNITDVISSGKTIYGKIGNLIVQSNSDLQTWNTIGSFNQLNSIYSDTNAVFAMTSNGLLYLPKGNHTWRNFSTNLIDSNLQSLSTDYTNLYSGTIEYGVWERNYSQLDFSSDSVVLSAVYIDKKFYNLSCRFDASTLSSVINLNLVRSANVNLYICDVLGRKLMPIVDGKFLNAGSYEFHPDIISNLRLGQYFVVGNINTERCVQKIILIK